MNTIEYYIKHSYGIPLCYVKDGATARAVSSLTGRKTITANDIQALQSLGFTFKQVLS